MSGVSPSPLLSLYMTASLFFQLDCRAGVPVNPDTRLWTPAIRLGAPPRALTTPYPVVPRGPTPVVRTALPRPFIECDRVRRSDAASDLRVLVARHALFGVAPRDLTTAAKGRAATTLYRVCSGKTTWHDTRSRPLPVSQVEGRPSSPPGCPP